MKEELVKVVSWSRGEFENVNGNFRVCRDNGFMSISS